MPLGDDYVMVKGATGQSEKAYFCKPLEYKLGKQWGIHKFLYMPNSPKALLGRDLLEQLGAKIVFKKGEITLEVKDQQYIHILSLTLTSLPLEGSINEDILNQVYPGVWATDAPGRVKSAPPVEVRIKEGQKLVRIKQYPLKKEDREGIRPVIEKFLQLGLLKEYLKDAFFCLPLHEASQKLFAFEWENPKSGRKTQLTWTVLPQGFKNSPTIFGNQLAKDLESWEAPSEEGKLLQYVDDILIATKTEEDCMTWTLLFSVGTQENRYIMTVWKPSKQHTPVAQT
ncbi:uncharacterized protein LOC128138226 [Harpia harpyja]|uniref:uncharacterized protein LOC128138226 n=1 Tax=Harpia harpyja TaxID=202280 RepID=UPI0022B1A1E9|nr:uncharacterized protein LOC128138226 [Harpia harpyja]